MTEPKIRDYLTGEITVLELVKDDRKDNKIRAYYKMVEAIEDGEFRITRDHLLKLSNDVLNNSLELSILESFSFVLIGSEYFEWEGDVISTVIFEWNNPTINYPLTIKNVREWRKFLSGKSRTMET